MSPAWDFIPSPACRKGSLPATPANSIQGRMCYLHIFVWGCGCETENLVMCPRWAERRNIERDERGTMNPQNHGVSTSRQLVSGKHAQLIRLPKIPKMLELTAAAVVRCCKASPFHHFANSHFTTSQPEKERMGRERDMEIASRW